MRRKYNRRTGEGIRIVSAQMVARCACGSTIQVTGTPSGCAANIQEWFRLDHSKPGCREVTKHEQQALKRAKAKAQRAAGQHAQAMANAVVPREQMSLF